MRELDLDRLLRAAADVPNESSPEMPFGFDTRVVANWRAQRPGNGAELWSFAGLLRRVALSALAVTICAGSAAWWQIRQNDELDSPTSDAYAIADTAIEAGTWQ